MRCHHDEERIFRRNFYAVASLAPRSDIPAHFSNLPFYRQLKIGFFLHRWRDWIQKNHLFLKYTCPSKHVVGLRTIVIRGTVQCWISPGLERSMQEDASYGHSPLFTANRGIGP